MRCVNRITVESRGHLQALTNPQAFLLASCGSEQTSNDVFRWNASIRENVSRGGFVEALSDYHRMQKANVKPDHFTFPFVLKACGELSLLNQGTALHQLAYTNGFVSTNVFVCNALVTMYGRCGNLNDARQVFDEIPQRDIVSWNSIIAAYAQRGAPDTALYMFSRSTCTQRSAPNDAQQMCHKIPHRGFRPDVISLVNVLPACASLGASGALLGRQVHAYAIRNDLSSDLFVANATVDLYSKCGLMGEALKVFRGMQNRDVVSWNAMVTGYVRTGSFGDAMELIEKMRKEKIELNVVTWSAVIAGYAQWGHGHEALGVFRQMQLCGGRDSEPNDVTLVSLLSACASVGALLQGKEAHGHAVRRGWSGDVAVKNALVDMYAKCSSRNTDVARRIFDSITMDERNVVTWTVMIGGHAQNGEANDALHLFSRMLQEQGVQPNAFTLSCALMACSQLSALRLGQQIHGYVIRNRYKGLMFVDNCLLDMYSKCGAIEVSQKVFDEMPEQNSVSWTSMITGYGMHGRGDDALMMFHKMQQAGLAPDDVTFIVVLYACSHSGMVEEGLKYFEGMDRDYGVVPGVEHYACVIDLLGRAGRLEEAKELIENMPMEPSSVVWVALLSACRNHVNVELGEFVAEKLSKLGGEWSVNAGSSTLLSNIYADAGRWRDVARIRWAMKKAGVKKRPGCSWIQAGKDGSTATATATATFFVGDRSHPQSPQIYAFLDTLIQRIKAQGYVPQTCFALHDVDEEEKGSLLTQHSEKLALAYGLLNTPPGAPIRITKNLRVCGDCHTAITFISDIVEHEIIVRDSSRFHHFDKGSCSCGGYW